MPANDTTRVDVFSVSGGVGKTLLAIRLAQLQAKKKNAPVLLVDADIAGPCIGDLLEGWVSPPWDSTDNLLHLICGRPEYLPERLRPGKLPVYKMRAERPASAKEQAPLLVTRSIGKQPEILFCPSHPHSTSPRVEPAVVHALLGHESAGGWIGYVIDEVIRETQALMKGNLGGVIVDHGSALGALQTVTLRAGFERPPEAREPTRRALIVATPRASDLASARDLAGRITAFAPRFAIDEAIVERLLWVVNRVEHDPADDATWREAIKQRFPRNDGWIDRALPVCPDPKMDKSHAVADLGGAGDAAMDKDLERVRERLFG